MPKGGMFIWAKIPDTEKDSETFAMNLLREKQILVTPGSAFGKNGERFVRVSYCSDITKINEYF
jgi:aspartate/methionine/tyrosine aminotransferase